jgi:hypothetical protein
MVDSRNAFIFFSTNGFKIVLSCLKIIEQPCPSSAEWNPKFTQIIYECDTNTLQANITHALSSTI